MNNLATSTMNKKNEFLSMVAQFSKAEKNPAALEDAMTLEQLGIDSLASVTLLLEIESSFGISIPTRVLTPDVFSTIGSLWKVIEGFVSAK